MPSAPLQLVLASLSGAMVTTAHAETAPLVPRQLGLSWQPDDSESVFQDQEPLRIFEGVNRPYARVWGGLGSFDDWEADGLAPDDDTTIEADILWTGGFAWGLDYGRLFSNAPDNADIFGIGARVDVEIGAELFYYNGTLVNDPEAEETDGDGVVTALCITLNGFLDFEMPGPVSFFVGAGVGPALLVRTEDSVEDGDESAVVQWTAGVAVQIDYDMDFFIAYRQREYLTDPSFGGVTINDLSSESIELGFILRF